MGGTAQQAGGDVAGLSSTAAVAAPVTTELSDTKVYEDYRPKIIIAGAKPHPTPLAESAAMASVEAPKTTYRPKLPDLVVNEGLLSGAQLETTVLAGQAHQSILPNGERRGFFIGDGTGVGKGREIAAVLWDNWNQGRHKAIWLSENSALAIDARRDLRGIGFDDGLLFELGDVKAGKPIAVQKGILFASYDTLRSKEKVEAGKQGRTRLDQIVDWFGPGFDGVIAFDEAHNMGNALEIKGGRGKKKPSLKALSGVELQKRLPKARVVYVSATGATEVTNLSYASRLGLWGEGTPFPSVSDFVTQIQTGGVAAMELVARDLKALGLYLARNLSFDGVTYKRIEHPLTPAQTMIYDELAGAWQGVLADINAALGETGGDKDSDAKGAAMSAFWGSHQRFFNQIITSMQMPSVVEFMHKSIDLGHAIVCQLVNTNDAATSRQLAAKAAEGSEVMEDLDLTPREALMQFVERSFPTTQFETYFDDNGNEQSRPVKDAAGNFVQNSDAVARKEALLERLGSISVPDGPLEIILNEFGTDMVAEVTGRKRRIVWGTDDKGNRTKMVEKRSEAKTRADSDAFMDDKKPILVFSMKGGTGRTYSADLTRKNQRPRDHILLQPGWRADKAVQGFGRTHRSNQKQPPCYVLVTTNLKAQKRFISSIARRLDQLGALTKGQRQTGGQGFFEERDNLESQYAKDALESFFTDVVKGEVEGVSLAEFQAQTGLALVDERGNMKAEMPGITKFLNRLLSLKTDMMDLVFTAFARRMEILIQRAIENDSLDRGLETLKALSTRVVREQTVYREPKTGSETRYVELELRQKTVLTPWERALAQAANFGFVVNRQSGQVWCVTHRLERTASDGSIHREYRLTSPKSTHFVPAEDLTDAKFERVPALARAEGLWRQSLAEAPKTYTEQKHLVTGVILPIWDRLKGRTRIIRVQTDDGRRMLGRLVNPADLAGVMRALGAEVRGPELSNAEAFAKVLDDNYRLALANGWTIKRSLVAGDNRVELIGPDITTAKELKDRGVISERIGFKTRFFIPTGHAGAGVLAAVTSRRPIVSADPPVTRSTLPAETVPTEAEAALERAQDELNGAKTPRQPGVTGESGFINPSIIHDLVKVGLELLRRGFASLAAWSKQMLRLLGSRVNRFLAQVWTRVQNVQAAGSMGLSAEGVANRNRIEAQGTNVNQRPAVQPAYPEGKFDSFYRRVGRASRRLSYFGSESLLRAKQQLDLTESYQAAAVKAQSDNLLKQLENSAYTARPGEFKLPQFLRLGAWASRLRKFQKLALPIAAHLHVTGRDASGQFVFTGFEMRAGWMTPREFTAGGHQVGDTIIVSNPLTGEQQALTIGGMVQTRDRMGYQLTRNMPADQQAELYRYYTDEYPEFQWFLDMFIDPDLAGTRQTINGVEVPVFNRFALAAMMAQNNPNFTPLDAYTPDVLVTRSLLGAVRGALGLRRGTSSPGRRYKTGQSRESGNVRDLVSAFNTRTFQMLREDARRQFVQAALREAVPVKGGLIPEGYVKLDTGIDEIWTAIQRLRGWQMPTDPVTGQPVFPETERRLQSDGSPEFKAFFGEAAKLRGRQLMIPKELVDLLVKRYSTHKAHGLLWRIGAWAVRNTTQLYLAHPKTYVANVLTNDMFSLEAAYRFALSGMMKLAGRRHVGMEDLRLAGNVLSGMVLNRFVGLRELLHIADSTQYLKTVREILPDQIFADATQLSDVKARYDDKPFDLLRQGEIGGAVLAGIRYGTIDVRAKQRLAYAFLKARAVTHAKGLGLRGGQLRAAVDAYMASPPMPDRVQAVAMASFEMLNYADSPDWLNAFSRNDYGRLVLPFPRFGYHFLAKQGQRLSALKIFLGKVPKGQRVDALADLITVGTFGLGAGGLVAYWLLQWLLGDDSDEARKYVGTSAVKYVDADGQVKTKNLDRTLVTANRINLSAWARALGFDTVSEDDFWLRVRNYPAVAMAGAAVLALNDTRKYGPGTGLATYLETVTDLGSDFFSVGMALKLPDKAMASLRSMETGRPERPILDPYATSVPLVAYVTEQALDSFVPGSRQFDELVLWLDPVDRRKTASKQLGYEPGPWEMMRIGHVGGVVDRVMARLNDEETSLPAAGEVKTVTTIPRWGEGAERKELRADALEAIAAGRPEASEFVDVNGTRRLAVVPQASRRVNPTETLAASLAGFNVRPFNREQYEAALLPPEEKPKPGRKQ